MRFHEEPWGWRLPVLKTSQLEVASWLGLAGGEIEWIESGNEAATVLWVRWGNVLWRDDVDEMTAHGNRQIFLWPGKRIEGFTFETDSLVLALSLPGKMDQRVDPKETAVMLGPTIRKPPQLKYAGGRRMRASEHVYYSQWMSLE